MYSALIAIEIHRAGHHKKTSKSKTDFFYENSLLGRPHFHIHLTLYNDFLCPSAVEIKEHFFKNPVTKLEDISVKKLNPDNEEKVRFDSKNWFMYCTKELSDLPTQKFLSKNIGLQSSCVLFWGHPNSKNDCLEVNSLFNHYNLNLISENLGEEEDFLLIIQVKK